MNRSSDLLRLIIRLFAGAFAVTAIFIFVGAWIIFSGPLRVDFVVPYFNRLVLDDYGVEIRPGKIFLEWDKADKKLAITANDVAILSDTKQIIYTLPKVLLNLSATSLLAGNPVLNEMEFTDVEFYFIRDKEGKINPAGDGGNITNSTNLVASILSNLSNNVNHNIFNELETIRFSDSSLMLDDKIASTIWQVTDFDAIFRVLDQGLLGDINLELELGDESIRFDTTTQFSFESGLTKINTSFSTINPSLINTKENYFKYFDAINMPISGHVSTVLEGGGIIKEIEYDLTASEGQLVISEFWYEPRYFDEISVRGSFINDINTLVVDDLFIKSGNTTGDAKGAIVLNNKGPGINLEANLNNITFGEFKDWWPRSLTPGIRVWALQRLTSGQFDEIAAKIQIQPGRSPDLLLSADELDVKFFFGGAELIVLKDRPTLTNAYGNATLIGPTFEITADSGIIGGLEVSEAHLRVDGINTITQSATAELVAAGTAEEFAYLFSFPPLSLNFSSNEIGGNIAMRANFAFPFRSDLKAAEIQFAAAANVNNFSLDQIPGGLELKDGIFEVLADAKKINANGTGKINQIPVSIDFLHLISNESVSTQIDVTGLLNESTDNLFGLDANNINGEVPFLVKYLGHGWQAEEVEVNFDLTSIDLNFPIDSWDKPSGEKAKAQLYILPRENNLLDVKNFLFVSEQIHAEAELVIDRNNRRAAGRAIINDVVYNLDWEDITAENEDGKSNKLTISGIFDNKSRGSIGYSFDKWISGPTNLSLELLSNGLTPKEIKLSIDLAPAEVRLPLWSKPTGIDGIVELLLIPDIFGNFKFRSFAVSSDGLVASGTIDQIADSTINEIKIARAIFGETTFSGNILLNPGGVHQINLKGQRLDVRPLLSELTDMAMGKSLSALSISAEFEKIIINDFLTLDTLNAIGEHNGVIWNNLLASAKLRNGASVLAKVTDVEDYYLLNLTSDDAGEFFREFRIFLGAEGGNLQIRGIYDKSQEAVFEGGVLVDAFHVARTPALAQILSLASLEGLNNVLQGQGITFVGFEAPFKYQEGAVNLSRARAWGPALGITINGEFNRRNDDVSLSGRLVPAYTINKVLGAIPLLGDLLVGEGVFAIDYEVTGNTQQPIITVNPLSALTPGFLRGIIFGFESEGAGPRPDLGLRNP